MIDELRHETVERYLVGLEKFRAETPVEKAEELAQDLILKEYAPSFLELASNLPEADSQPLAQLAGRLARQLGLKKSATT